MISGQVVDVVGMRNMFFIFAGFALVLFIGYTSLQCYLKQIPISSLVLKADRNHGNEEIVLKMREVHEDINDLHSEDQTALQTLSLKEDGLSPKYNVRIS